MKPLPLIAVASAVSLIVLLVGLVPSPPPSIAAAADAAATPSRFLLRDVRLFDGERLWPRASVLVADGLIEAVGESLDGGAGVTVVEGAGGTLLPGLIDAHVHSWGKAREQLLRFGVTTALDMFSDHRALAAIRTERTSLAPTTRADLWSAGTLVTVRAGHGTQFGMPIPTLDDAAHADAFVEARRAEGSDFIKLVLDGGAAYGGQVHLPTLSEQSLAAAIDAAHGRGLLAVVHVADIASAQTALDADADGLVHVASDAALDDRWMKAAHRRGMFVVATLSVLASLAGEPAGAALADDPRIAPWLEPAQQSTLRAAFPAEWRSPAHARIGADNVRRLQRAGVRVLAGSDAGNPGTAHGASLHGELALLVDAGLSPLEALRAATSVPADAFGLSDRGRIAAGMRADLVLVDGDPSTDIGATRAIRAVWKNGRRVAREIAAVDAQATRLPATRFSDFDDVGTPLAVARGAGWMPTTDRMIGGNSSVELQRVALDHGGALAIRGRVEAGASVAWAGAMLMTGEQPMQPVDAGALTQLRVRVRGDGRDYEVLLFSGADERGIPARQRFRTTDDWQTLQLDLARFPGADPGRLRALAFTAGSPAGDFELLIDDVEIR